MQCGGQRRTGGMSVSGSSGHVQWALHMPGGPRHKKPSFLEVLLIGLSTGASEPIGVMHRDHEEDPKLLSQILESLCNFE